MPEQKGRKRVRDRRRERRERVSVMGTDAAPADEEDQPSRPVIARQPPPQPGMPSPTARVTGLMISIVTALIAAGMIYNAVSGDSSGSEALVRVAIGAGLILLAAFVAVLVLAPTQVRRFLGREKRP